MNLFLNDGHLAEGALQALEDGRLCESDRLQIAEHLSVCDDCLLQYSLFLTDDRCLSPEMPLEPPVTEKVRRRAVKVFTSRYAVAAASILLAMALWATGLFNALVPDRTSASQGENKDKISPISVLTTVSTSIDHFFNSITEGLSRGWEPHQGKNNSETQSN